MDDAKGIAKMKIAGVVLAGGLSTRMGQDKALLHFESQSLLARSVNLLKMVGLDKVIVSGDYPSYTCVVDVYPQLGPLSGIQACVESLFNDYDALFILPVDMPLLSESECEHLLESFAQYPQGVFYQNATFPLILPLNTALKDYLSEALSAPEKKQRSLYRLLNTLNIQSINGTKENNFRFQNSNTPAQWADCLAISNHLAHKDKS